VLTLDRVVSLRDYEDFARAYMYCMEQTYGTGIELTIDGGALLL